MPRVASFLPDAMGLNRMTQGLRRVLALPRDGMCGGGFWHCRMAAELAEGFGIAAAAAGTDAAEGFGIAAWRQVRTQRRVLALPLGRQSLRRGLPLVAGVQDAGQLAEACLAR